MVARRHVIATFELMLARHAAGLATAEGGEGVGGVLLPTTPDIYVPALRRLADEGMHFTEEVERLE